MYSPNGSNPGRDDRDGPGRICGRADDGAAQRPSVIADVRTAGGAGRTGDARARARGAARSGPARQVLRGVPQREVENRRADARQGGSGAAGRARRGSRESDPQGQHRPDASRRTAASRQGQRRSVRHSARSRAGQGGGGRAQSGPGCGAPSQSPRIHQRRPRPAGAGHRPRAAPRRQRRRRVRQQRRHPLGHAGADEPLHVGGHQGQPAGHRRPGDSSRDSALQGVGLGDPDRTHRRRPAVWRARRLRRQASVSARR